MRKHLDYIIFIIMLAFTTFEYFFREDKLAIVFSLFAMMAVAFRATYRKYQFSLPIIFICILLVWSLIQCALIPGRPLIIIILLGITLFGAMSIAMIIKDRFVSIFITTIYYIAIVALVIYLLCLNQSIQSYMIDDLAKNFTSLNVELAVVEGGGKNFIIYNFVSGDEVLESTGLLRNCGPFWEPGMFAVFLNIALFLHNVVEKQNLKWCNVVLILALITTFSAGGYIAGLFVLFSRAIIASKKNYFVAILGLVMFIFVSRYVMQLEYVGEKLVDQMENIEEGTDISRFSAFLTQVTMIENSPILGGERLSDYVSEDKGTLASGTLLPFVRYGIPLGLFYMIVMLISMIRFGEAYGKGKIEGVLLFILLLILSFSQTILLSKWMFAMLFVGLIKKKSVTYNI